MFVQDPSAALVIQDSMVSVFLQEVLHRLTVARAIVLEMVECGVKGIQRHSIRDDGLISQGSMA